MKLEKELRKVEEIEYKSKLDPFTEYVDTFIQRLPRYTVKLKESKHWRTKNKALSDIPIFSHLEQKYIIGVLAQWYPGFAILDIDDQPKERAEEIRERLGLDTESSMLFSSESPESYHLLFRPSYKKKPPTIKLLNEILKPFSNENGIEIYPQANRAIRLPFGYGQEALDFEYINLKSWEQKLYWFLKLDWFDLKGVPYQQLRLDIDLKPQKMGISSYQEGRYLLLNGLLEPHSRHESQFKVLYYLLRQNIPPEIAINMVWKWIYEKHNGLSKDIVTSPRSVKGEIERQAKSMYGRYELKQIYPDSTHNNHRGYITKDDITDIILISKASLPKAKFLFNLVKFCYPRRYRTFINLHSDNLKEWSQKGYIEHLEELQRQGIITRYDSYQVDKFSKSIKVNWNFKDVDKAVLIDHRAPEEFKDTIKASYDPKEFRELLVKAGSKREVAIITTSRLFKT